MSISRKREMAIPEIALIAATRGALGFGAGNGVTAPASPADAGSSFANILLSRFIRGDRK